MLTWLRAVFAPLIAWIVNGSYVFQTQRAYLALGAGFTVTDDPQNNRTLIDVGGAASNPTFTSVTTGSLNVPPYALDPQPQTTTTGDATANLLVTSISVATRQSVKVRFTVRASIFGQTAVPTAELVGEATLVNLSGSASLFWKNAVTAESNQPQPFAGLIVAPPITVSGAANNGSGLVRLTVASTSGIVAGQTLVTVASVGGVSAADGTWVVDSIPDGTHIDLRGTTFSGTYTSGGTVTILGSVSFVVSGATCQVRAVGLKGAPWQQGETAAAYTLRTTPSGLYLCTTGGTTLGSGTGPTGTGSDIDDNGVKWEQLSNLPNATVIWQATIETWTIQG